MMRLTAHGDQRFESGLPASLDIHRAEIAGIRQQRFGRAQLFGQSLDLVQHRFELLLVVWRLNHIGRNDQQAPRGHDGLRVVALLEAPARRRHDARILVGEIGLVLRQRPFDRRRGRLAAGLLAGRGGFGRARGEFGLVLGPANNDQRDITNASGCVLTHGAGKQMISIVSTPWLVAARWMRLISFSPIPRRR